METIIAVIDAISVAACLAALVIVGTRYKKVFKRNVSFVLVVLLILTAVFMVCVHLKWSGLVETLLAIEDTLGTLLPIAWGFLFYVMVQEIVTEDTLLRETVLKQEVAERKLAEEKARQYNIKLSVIVENVSSALLMETADRKMEFTNSQFCQMFAIPSSPESLVGVDCRQSAQASKALFKDAERFCSSIETAVTTGKETCFELLETVDGRFLERDYLPVYDDEKLVYHLWVYRDVTRRVIAETAIKNAVAEWRTTFDSISDMIAITDGDYNITRTNRAFASAFGVEPADLIGQKACTIVHGLAGPIDNCPCIEAQKTLKPSTREFLHTRNNMSIEVTASPIVDNNGKAGGSVLVIRDITERKNMQQQLIVHDRLASIGELVSGVAHEINNPLTSVIGFSDYLLQGELSPNVKEGLEYINRDARRTASIVNNLMIFAREQPEQKTPLDINEILNRVLSLHAHALKVKNISVTTSYSNDLPAVMGNTAQLHQVFSNIIINAEQAMYEKEKKGTLSIDTQRSGQDARIILADSGPGIEEGIIDKIFNPFFTTREVGQGTGLGLSIAHGIITEHGGSIRAESRPGNGTVFTIDLPGVV
ncbi:MAG: ATP-binding protein [Dehalococcoidales bacterium]|nr:ATP-binding protein [Dehalococcoidales bacterium]